MQVRSSLVHIDTALEEAARELLGSESMRVRVQPSLLRLSPDGKREFRAWRHLHWMVELGSVDEGRELREALDAFFLIAGRQGIGALKRHLAPLTTLGATVAG